MCAPETKPNADRKQVEKQDLKDAPRDKKNLDEGLEETMDGSDPPSTTQP